MDGPGGPPTALWMVWGDELKYDSTRLVYITYAIVRQARTRGGGGESGGSDESPPPLPPPPWPPSMY